MKKTLSTLLVGSMLLFPIPALATDDTDTIHSLSFDTLDEEMTAHSPLILDAEDSMLDNSSNLNDNLNLLKSARTGLVTGVNTLLSSPLVSSSKGTQYVPGMTANDLVVPSVTLPITSDEWVMYTQASSLLTQINTLEITISSLEEQQAGLWKSWLQVEQGKDQTIWGAQQIYLSYYSLYEQKDNLTTNLSLLQKQLSVLQLKETLGMATHLEVIEKESEIKDRNMSLDQINKGLEGIKGQLNVFLGQDYDTSLQLKEPLTLSQSKINAMDYEEDLEDALVQSYKVRLEEDSDKREDAERNFTLAFHNAYQSVQDKKEALDLERYKLTNAKAKYDQAVLMNSLGLMSNLDFEGSRSLYTTQVNAVDTAEQELLSAYTAYDWMKQGLTISSTPSATSQSTGASGASTGAGF